MYSSIAATRKALHSGTTVLSIVEHFLKEIDNRKELNAFLEVFSTTARSEALRIDQKIKDGTAGNLAGVVIGIKDNICYKNHKVSASSKILHGHTTGAIPETITVMVFKGLLTDSIFPASSKALAIIV